MDIFSIIELLQVFFSFFRTDNKFQIIIRTSESEKRNQQENGNGFKNLFGSLELGTLSERARGTTESRPLYRAHEFMEEEQFILYIFFFSFTVAEIVRVTPDNGEQPVWGRKTITI